MTTSTAVRAPSPARLTSATLRRPGVSVCPTFRRLGTLSSRSLAHKVVSSQHDPVPRQQQRRWFAAGSTPSAAPQTTGQLVRGMLVGAAGAAAAILCLAAPLPSSMARADPPAMVEFAATRGGVVDKTSTEFLKSRDPVPSAQELMPEELSNVRLFQENTPSVVNIANIVQARSRYSMDVLNLPQGQGSGFVWDREGHIVTNYHVIRGASQLRVALIDQSVWPAKVIGGDPSKDVAVLQLDAPPEVLRSLKPVTVGQSDVLFVGQKVLAIGNPFGLDHSMSSGIISGLNRELPSIQGPGLRNMLQTDAAVNPGNSGGPLLDSKGRIIGINTAIFSGGGGTSTGVGFAIPIDTVQGLVGQILTYGRIIRPVLGISLAPPQASRQLGLEGVLVLDVSPGSPAAKAGLLGISRDALGRLVIGDVIVGVEGRPIRKQSELFEVLDGCKVGQEIKVDVLRRGEEKKTVAVVLAERQPELSE